MFGNLLSMTDARPTRPRTPTTAGIATTSETQGSDSRTVLLDGLGNVRHTTDRDGREISSSTTISTS